MKIALKILATILLVITMGGSLLLTIRNSRESAAVSDLSGIMEAMGYPSAGEFKFAMIVCVLLVIVSIVGIVMAFMKNKPIGMAVAALLILLGLLLIIFQPSSGGRMDPKNVAMVMGVCGILSGACLGGLKMIKS